MVLLAPQSCAGAGVAQGGRSSGVTEMAKQDSVPTRAFEALAWLDPSVTRQDSRRLDRHAQPHTVRSVEQDSSSPEGDTAAGDGSGECQESRVEEMSRGPCAPIEEVAGQRLAEGHDGVRSRKLRYGKIAAATQVLLLFALCATVFVALFCDSRLYYGIGVDGQPIYQECPREPGVIEASPASADSPSGSDRSEPLHNTASLPGLVLEKLPTHDSDSRDITAAHS